MTRFPSVRGKRILSEKSFARLRTSSFGFLAPCQNLEKTNDLVPRKHPDRGKDGHILIYKTYRATAAGPVNIEN